MAGEYVFNLNRVTKQHNKTTVLDEVTLAFYHGSKIGMIGGNGAGKTTLMRVLAGEETDIMGDLIVAKNTKVGYLPQEPHLDPSKDVSGNVAEGVAECQVILDRYDEICDLLGGDMSDAEADSLNDELGLIQDKIDDQNLWELEYNVEMAMEALRLPPGDADVSKLSGGECRRVALCRLLISNPDVLLLDEPTNHLDSESVAWLEEYLMNFKGTLVVITHDRYFLNNVTEWILEMESGRANPYKGNYEAWLVQKQELIAKQAKGDKTRAKMIDRELDWIRMNPAGRRAKNKARISRYEEMVAKQIDTRVENLEIQIPSGDRLGTQVVDATNLTKAFGDRVIMDDVTFSLPPGGIVGIIGGNGAGKTTLFKMITGEELPTGGEMLVGPTVDVSYVDQSRDSLVAEHSVWEEISGGKEFLDLGGHSMNSRGYCARFNFRGPDQQKLVGQLSGGERNRVHLAKLLRRGGNLLLLDEPTNDLDIQTLRALEDALQNFGGCAVVISHDRWFLDRVATHILAFEGDSTAVWCEGNYETYQEERRRRLGDAADRPSRLRFKPLVK